MGQTEERLFTLMVHAEDLQRVAQNSIQEVGKAIQRMETGTGNAILSVVRAGTAGNHVGDKNRAYRGRYGPKRGI